jgi:hypothetical protein
MVSPINDLAPFCVVASAAVSALFVSNLCGRAQPVEREHVELPLHLHRGGQETRLAVAPLVTHRVVSSFPCAPRELPELRRRADLHISLDE